MDLGIFKNYIQKRMENQKTCGKCFSFCLLLLLVLMLLIIFLMIVVVGILMFFLLLVVGIILIGFTKIMILLAIYLVYK